mmetsp:Transcript_3241/g.11264  ORF Transcript_3241/g.11264 Transcript_3241/m.11264 type:complete len:412 (-) Transcript_3241:1522-2757(-)
MSWCCGSLLFPAPRTPPSLRPSFCSIKSPALTSSLARDARRGSSVVIQCDPEFTGRLSSSPFPVALGTRALENDATASSLCSPGTARFMDMRHGVPRTAPEARVSPCPSASSAYATVLSLLIGCLVIRMNDTSGTSICCTKTAMAASFWPTPAAARLPTARVVNSDAQTSATAAPSTFGSCGFTFETESYSPAADNPARSSALPVDRTITTPLSLSNKLPSWDRISPEGRNDRASSWSSSHSRAARPGSPAHNSRASTREDKRPSAPTARAAASIDPNGSTAPAGAAKPQRGSLAIAASCAHAVPFDPATATALAHSAFPSVTRSMTWPAALRSATSACAGARDCFESPPPACAVTSHLFREMFPPGCATKCTPPSRSDRAWFTSAGSSIATSGHFACLDLSARCDKCGRA